MKFLWYILVYAYLVFRTKLVGNESTDLQSASGTATAIPNDFDYIDFCDDDLPEIEHVREPSVNQHLANRLEIKLLPIVITVAALTAKLALVLAKNRKRSPKLQQRNDRQIAVVDTVAANATIETARKRAAQQIEKFVHFSYTLPKFHLKQCDRNDNTLPFDLYRNENNEFFSKSF